MGKLLFKCNIELGNIVDKFISLIKILSILMGTNLKYGVQRIEKDIAGKNKIFE